MPGSRIPAELESTFLRYLRSLMQLPRTHGEWPNRDQLLTVRIHVVSKNRRRKHGFQLPEELVAQRVALASSGASGAHQGRHPAERVVTEHKNAPPD